MKSKGIVRNFLKKVTLWSLVITMLFSTTAMAAFTVKDANVTMNNVLDQMKKATEYQVIARVMQKCIQAGLATNDDFASDPYKKKPEDLFDENHDFGNDTDVSMGSWLAKYVTGMIDVDDIADVDECSDLVEDREEGSPYTYGIVSAFSEMLFGTVSDEKVICNKEDSSKPGLFIAYEGEDGQAPYDDCWSHFSDSDLRYTYTRLGRKHRYKVWFKSKSPNNDYDAEYGGGSYNNDNDDNTEHYYATLGEAYKDGDIDHWEHAWIVFPLPSDIGFVAGSPYTNGEQYVMNIYEQWRQSQSNPYIKPWNELYQFPSFHGYYSLLNDFDAGCKRTSVGAGATGSDVVRISRIKNEDDKLSIEDEYYRLSDDNPDQKSVTGVERTCKELAEAVNGNYLTEFKNELMTRFKNECKKQTKNYWDFARRKAEVVLSSEPDKAVRLNQEGNVVEEYLNYEWVDGVQKLLDYTDDQKKEARDVIAQELALRATDYTVAGEGGLLLTCRIPDGYTITTEPPTVDPLNPGNYTDAEKRCQNMGGAKALGWIVCPIMEWMGDAATDVYNKYLVPQLNVSPRLFTNNAGDGGNTTENVWKTFQGMANILFSIILLIIIFSQLTGVGIDNYGIKKILPKLILAAVLTNLSYTICQLFVDLSNILGNSLQNMFNGMVGEARIIIPETSIDGTANNGVIPTTVITGVMIGGLLALAVGAIWQNPAIILTLLVGLLGVLVAILFVFILLAARQAAIVVLIVISPLAFVCYALPNTKKLFDKWLKLMQGLLMVYPICGLLIGGGNFASRLLLAANGDENSFMSALTAMLISIVPLFFIPTVLKNSLNALAGLGNKISGFGKGAGNWTKGRVTNSRGYKDAQNRGNPRADRLFERRRAGLRIGANGEVRERGLRRRLARTRFGRAVGMDVDMQAKREKFVQDEMNRRANAESFTNLGVVQAQVAKAQNAQDTKIGEANAGVSRTNEAYEEQMAKNAKVQKDAQIAEGAPVLDTKEAQAAARQKFRNARAEAEIDAEIGVAPINRENVRQKLQNRLNEALADNKVGVVPVDVDLAVQRKRALAEAQELKNFQDQFAGFERGDKDSTDLNSLQGQANALVQRIQQTGKLEGSDVQRMQALIGAMESRGMEHSIADMLEQGGEAIGKNSHVMQTLASSKNRVFKAYGKNGTNMSYDAFMSGDANAAQSLAHYASEKGSDFINDLDDKALTQIAKYQNRAGGPQIMSGDMIAQAQARINSQDAVTVLDGMMKNTINNGGSVNFSAAQFASLNQSTRTSLGNMAMNNAGVRENLINISDEMVRSPEHRSRLSNDGINILNTFRATRNDGGDTRRINDVGGAQS